jgi:hypothetical protein
MLSRKPRRRRRVRRRPAESSLSQIAEAARAIIALAVGCRTAARGLLNARLQSSASLRNGDGGKRNSPPDGSNSPRSETGRIASGGHGAAKNAAESPSRPEMASQRIEKIESAPGNGMVSGASKPQDLVYGRAADCPLRRTKGGRLGNCRETFPPCKSLETNETELESLLLLPVRRTPMQRRRPSRRIEGVASNLGVARGKSAGRRMQAAEIFLSTTP